MAFADVFWQAFASAGMLVDAWLLPEAGDPAKFAAGFAQPDVVVLDGVAQTTDYTLEYRASDVTLARRSRVKVGATIYEVVEPPRARRDGDFYVAILEKVPA